MTRYYVFEDNAKDDIQRLFAVAYGGYGNTPINMIWSNGVSLIEAKVDEIYANRGIDTQVLKKEIDKKEKRKITEEEKERILACKENLALIYDELEIYVFMDLVPDNPALVKIYNRLKKLKQQGYNILVFPIPCAEYYMIKVLCELNVQSKTPDIMRVLNRSIYYNSPLLNNPQNQEFVTNFEKFCKLVFKHLDKKCLHKSSEEDKDREQNNLKGRFYRADCSSCTDCELAYLLQEKAEKLLLAYPCFPPGAIILYSQIKDLSRAQCIAKHRRLVDDYKKVVKRYSRYIEQSKLKLPKLKKDLQTVEYFI